MAAEIHGDRLDHPTHAAGTGLMADIKAHKIEVVLGGATLLLTIFFISRSGGKKTATTSSGSGLLNTAPTAASGSSGTPSNTVTTDTLAAALAAISGQEHTDIQGIQAQLGAFGQTISRLGTGSTASSGAGGISGSNPGVIGSGSTNPGSGLGGVVQSNGNAITNALQARNSIGDNVIINFFSALSLPSWIGLQYVAENFALPWTPGSTPTSGQLSAFNNWLDSHGYRNASTNSFTALVSSGSVPASVQSQLTAAYGG